MSRGRRVLAASILALAACGAAAGVTVANVATVGYGDPPGVKDPLNGPTPLRQTLAWNPIQTVGAALSNGAGAGEGNTALGTTYLWNGSHVLAKAKLPASNGVVGPSDT
jgi:hypothetical protein